MKDNNHLRNGKRQSVLNIIIAVLITLLLWITINIISTVVVISKAGLFALLRIAIPTVIFCGLIFILIKGALAGNKWAKILLIIMAVLTALSLICAMFFLKFICDGMVGCCETARNLP